MFEGLGHAGLKELAHAFSPSAGLMSERDGAGEVAALAEGQTDLADISSSAQTVQQSKSADDKDCARRAYRKHFEK